MIFIAKHVNFLNPKLLRNNFFNQSGCLNMSDKQQILLNLEEKRNDHENTELIQEEKQLFVDANNNNKSENKFQLQTKVDYYNGPFAFERTLKFGCYERCKMIICSPIVFLKFIIYWLIIEIAIIGILFKYLCCCCLCNCSNKCCSKILRYWFRCLLRISLCISCGFCWIRTKGKRPKKYPRVIIANHVSMTDAWLMYYMTGASFVAAIHVARADCCNKCIQKEIGLIYIDHSSKDSKRETVKKIVQHVNNEALPSLFIFPEGTVHNTQTLTRFKIGAFKTGHAVLPMYIDYTNCCADVWMGDWRYYGVGNSCHLMSQCMNFVTITWMDVYQPNDDEKADPVLYGENVRKYMADIVNKNAKKKKVFLTPYDGDDMWFYGGGGGAGLKDLTQQFVLRDIRSKLKIDMGAILGLAAVYRRFCDDGNKVGFDKFCEIFHIENKQIGRKVFGLFCGGKDDIVFGDFLVGLSVCYQPDLIQDAMMVFYVIMMFYNGSNDDDGSINLNEGICGNGCKEILKSIEKDADKSFNESMDEFCVKVFGSDDNTKLSLSQFKQSVKETYSTKFVQLFLQFVVYAFLETRMDIRLAIC